MPRGTLKGGAGARVEINQALLDKLEKAGPEATSRFADRLKGEIIARAPVAAVHHDQVSGVDETLKDSVEARRRKGGDGAILFMNWYGFFQEFGFTHPSGQEVTGQHFVERGLAAAEADLDNILNDVT